MIVIVPDKRNEELSLALARGLERDADRCFADEHAVAVLVEPEGPLDRDGGGP